MSKDQKVIKELEELYGRDFKEGAEEQTGHYFGACVGIRRDSTDYVYRVQDENVTELGIDLVKLDQDPKKLERVKAAIRKLENLKILNIKFPNEKIPEWLREFKKLEYLCLNDNKLTVLPEWLAEFQNLEYLSLGKNNLTRLPEWLLTFNRLKGLNVGSNNLEWNQKTRSIVKDLIEKRNVKVIIHKFFRPDFSTKYNNVELVPEEADWLRDMEKTFGTPLPQIDNLTWKDFRIDEQTRKVEEFEQHQFGFIAEDKHVIALGLSLTSINVKSINISDWMPSIYTFKKLKTLDVHGWEKLFSKPDEIRKQREEDYNKKFRGGFGLHMSFEDRRKMQSDARRELSAPIDISGPDDLFTQSKGLDLHYLDASNCHLKNGLKSLSRFKNLQYLNLSSNKTEKVHEELGGLEKLQTLILTENPIKEYPSALDSMKSLKKLDLSNTGIKDLPDSVSNLNLLEELTLPTGIIDFPKSFVEFKNLKSLVASNFPDNFKELKKLETLTIKGGKMEALPDSIGELSALKMLRIEDCLSLMKLPETIGNLKSLATLEITGNKSIETLPQGIFNLNNLQTLNLYNNNLKTLPDEMGGFPQLEILILSNNALIHLPYSIYKLNNLIEFSVENNPLEKTDKLISSKTLPEIKAYSKKKMAINVFISHAVVDFEPCHLEELSQFLERQIEVDTAFLCERDLSGNIDAFMDKNVPQSQLVLFIGTPTSANSKDCQYELKLSREYSVQIIPLKSSELGWADLATIGLSRELGIEIDFSDYENFPQVCADLYDYIKQLKRSIDLHDKEQGKIDRLTIGLKALERKMEDIEKRLEAIAEKVGH